MGKAQACKSICTWTGLEGRIEEKGRILVDWLSKTKRETRFRGNLSGDSVENITTRRVEKRPGKKRLGRQKRVHQRDPHLGLEKTGKPSNGDRGGTGSLGKETWRHVNSDILGGERVGRTENFANCGDADKGGNIGGRGSQQLKCSQGEVGTDQKTLEGVFLP